MIKLFHIHIFLMATSLLIECQQYNTTTASSAVPYSNGSLMGYSGPYHGTVYKPAFAVGSLSQTHNRKERRVLGQRKQPNKTKKLTIDDEVERISNRIYKDIECEDRRCCCLDFIDDIVCQVSASIAIRFSSEDTIIRTLQNIDKNIQETQNAKEAIKLLAEKNGVFQGLVDRLARYRKEKGLTGSNIDEFFYAACMFPMLSNALGSYIEKQVKDRVFEGYQEQKRVNAYFMQRENTFIGTSSVCTYTRTMTEIHTTMLVGHEYPIDEDSIMMSSDNRYIKAMDISDGVTIIWDMLTGERCDEANEGSIVWLTKELYERGDRVFISDVLFKNQEKYHISLCASPQFLTCIKVKIPTLFLYIKPNFISSLCQQIFFKNRDDNVELNALLNSYIVQKVLTGFPQKNLIAAIHKAQEENRAKGENCLF